MKIVKDSEVKLSSVAHNVMEEESPKGGFGLSAHGDCPRRLDEKKKKAAKKQ